MAPKSGAPSSTHALHPRRARASAVVRPPSPPPTIRIGSLDMISSLAGHRPYLSQSGSPAKETTVAGPTDDPRRERTRNAPARHRARAGAGQHQRGVPRLWHLPHAVLSLAPAAGTVPNGRRASAVAAGPAGTPRDDTARGGAPGADSGARLFARRETFFL